MKLGRVLFAGASVLGALSVGASTAVAERFLGTPSSLGNGTVASYADLDNAGVPRAIGVVFSADALDALPTALSDGHHCFDANNDGVVDLATECSMWHERVLPVPSEASRRLDVPFKWALLNWNPGGHIPPGVFDTLISMFTFILNQSRIYSLSSAELAAPNSFGVTSSLWHVSRCQRTTFPRTFRTWGQPRPPWAII
jgi:hypothetical protein